MGEERTEQINVRCSTRDVEFINAFIHKCRGDMTPPEVFRIALKFFRINYEENGPEKCMMNMMDKL